MIWGDFLVYDTKTGRLFWKVARGPHAAIGTEAGSVRNDGRYRTFVLFHKRYYVHRVVYEMCKGPIPDGLCIDHLDGNGLNNRIENLRATTLSANQRNSRLPRNNPADGIIGLYRRGRGYEVRCGCRYIGYFADLFEACCARKSAERCGGYHENHGRRA